jgi:hypothetical protein
MTVPYLESPPDVIPIHLGRQLFVDDFLIETTTLKRTYHKAKYHPDSPVLVPDRPWEQGSAPGTSEGGPTAMPFSDGVWYDPRDKLFKMWYMGGYRLNRCYATSHDGIHWEKPILDVVPGTNIVSPGSGDTTTVWLDLDEKDPKKRFKMWREEQGKSGWGIYYSEDGIHWGSEMGRTGPAASPTTVFYNPFRNVWVHSVRSSHPSIGRYRRYWETREPTVDIDWKHFTRPKVGPRVGKDPMRLPLWICADKYDTSYPGMNFRSELYNLDAVAYESVMLGLFSMLRGPRNGPGHDGRPKIKELVVGFSRDGFHWHRPYREPIIGISKEISAWNAGNIQSVGGCCLVVGAKLFIYVSGRRLFAGNHQTCSTGLAIVRRDGFASMDAGAAEGALTTRPVRFEGKHLFVNVAADAGELRVEVLDRAGKAISSFSKDRCRPIVVNKTLQSVRWHGVDDLSVLAGKKEPVRFRFHLSNGQLYSFWVSPDRSGASHGYVAAAGPGFTISIDTVGRSEK